MREELEQKLQERFDFLRRPDLEPLRTRRYETIHGYSTYDNWGTSIPDGWYDLVVEMFSDIEMLYEKEGVKPDYKLSEMKEKYGTLRVYGGRSENSQRLYAIDILSTGESLRINPKETDTLSMSIIEITRRFEKKSQCTCSHCGVYSEDVKLRTERPVFGWYATLCDTCAGERIELYYRKLSENVGSKT